MGNRYRDLDETPMVDEENLVSNKREWSLRQGLGSNTNATKSNNRKLNDDEKKSNEIDKDAKEALLKRLRSTKGLGNRRITDEELAEMLAKEKAANQPEPPANDEAPKTPEPPQTADNDEDNEAEKRDDASVQPKKIGGWGWMKLIVGGELLNRKWAMRQVPLVLLIMCFLIIMVSNRYTVESLSREKIASRDRIDQMREQRIHARRQYQNSIQISTIAKNLDTIGVGIVAEPPYMIEKD